MRPRIALSIFVFFVFAGFAFAGNGGQVGVTRGSGANTTLVVSSTCSGSGPCLIGAGGIATDGGVVASTFTLSDGGGFITDAGADRHFGGFFAGGVLAAGSVVIMSRFTSPAAFTRLSTTIATPGADAVHTFTVDVFDLTSSTVACVTSAIPCNAATGTTTSTSCSGTVTTADDVQLRVNDSACLTTAPLLNIATEYR